MSVTIRDVARRAGVSISTVSAVMNGTKYVSPALRERVEQAIEELGYIPSLLGRALSSQRSSMLAYMIPTVSNPFFSSIIQFVESRVFQKGYGLLVCSSEGDDEKAKRYESFLVSAQVDGVLLSPHSNRSVEEQCQPFVDRGIPVVVLAGARAIPQVDCVVLDDAAGMTRLVEHVIALGHRRVAYVGQDESYSSKLRLGVLRKVLADHGLTVPAEWVVTVDASLPLAAANQTYQAVRDMLSQPDLPTAVLCHNDAVAIGVVQICYELGLHIPDDISVTGFDDTLAPATSPPLTTLRVPVEEMAVLATELLLERIGESHAAGSDGGPKKHVVEPELVVRASTGQPRTG